MDIALRAFAGIGLADLNAKAEMMTRLDQKYIVQRDRLREFLAQVRDEFDVLDMGGTRSFTYRTVYFDDAALKHYFAHHQGRRKRMKVRVRTYVESDLTFLEVKLKDLRNVTVKKRMRLDGPCGALDDGMYAFIADCASRLYGAAEVGEMTPSLSMQYSRSTLVAKAGGERMTIDGNLHFFDAERSQTPGDDVFILETKSERGNGLADALLRKAAVKPVSRCSKYCVGLGALGKVGRMNRFLPAIRGMGLGPVPVAAQASGLMLAA